VLAENISTTVKWQKHLKSLTTEKMVGACGKLLRVYVHYPALKLVLKLALNPADDLPPARARNTE